MGRQRVLDVLLRHHPTAYDPLERADRAVVLVYGGHPYAVVADDFRRDADPHQFTWRMYTPLTAGGQGSGSGTPSDPLVLEQAAGPALDLTFVEPVGAAPTLAAAQDGDGNDVRVATLVQSGVVDGRFLTLLHPRPDVGAARPSVARLEPTGGLGASVGWPDSLEVEEQVAGLRADRGARWRSADRYAFSNDKMT